MVIKKIKNIFKLVISLLFFLIVFLFLFFLKRKNFKDNKKRILIIKLDAIGDYILFRNFLEIIKADSKYFDYKITFLGNSVNKKIAESLDSKFVDGFIWLNNKNILFKPFYFLRVLNNFKYNFDLVLYPCYSREFIGDLFVRYSKSNEKMGFKGDTNCINPIIKKVSDGWYNNLVEVDENIIFEFYKNREFFSKILNKNIDIIKPEIKKNDLSINAHLNLPDNFVVIFPGAQEKKRRWPKINFVEISKFLINDHKKNIVVCGLKDDNLGFEMGGLFNLAGKTNLLESIYILSKADLVISNDTSGAHIASAVNVPTIVLSQFNHYGRFFPYPENIKNTYCLTPDILISDKEPLVDKFKNGSNVDISLIRIEDVKNMIDFVINN